MDLKQACWHDNALNVPYLGYPFTISSYNHDSQFDDEGCGGNYHQSQHHRKVVLIEALKTLMCSAESGEDIQVV